MILPSADRERAIACAEKVRMNVEARELLKRSTGESLGRITISLGVAMLAAQDTATSLLERADHCMYAAKRAGRNRTVSDRDDMAAPEQSKAA
jgi:diguanylate cyclase